MKSALSSGTLRISSISWGLVRRTNHRSCIAILNIFPLYWMGCYDKNRFIVTTEGLPDLLIALIQHFGCMACKPESADIGKEGNVCAHSWQRSQLGWQRSAQKEWEMGGAYNDLPPLLNAICLT